MRIVFISESWIPDVLTTVIVHVAESSDPSRVVTDTVVVPLATAVTVAVPSSFTSMRAMFSSAESHSTRLSEAFSGVIEQDNVNVSPGFKEAEF